MSRFSIDVPLVVAELFEVRCAHKVPSLPNVCPFASFGRISLLFFSEMKEKKERGRGVRRCQSDRGHVHLFHLCTIADDSNDEP